MPLSIPMEASAWHSFLYMSMTEVGGMGDLHV